VHVIRLFATEFAKFSRRAENRIRIIDVNVNFRFALAAGKYEGVAEFRECLAKFATRDVVCRHETLSAVSKTGSVVGRRKFYRGVNILKQGRVRHRGYEAVAEVVGKATDEFGKPLRTRINNPRFSQYLELFRRLGKRQVHVPPGLSEDGHKFIVRVACDLAPHTVGECGNHGDDGSLARLGQGVVSIPGARGHSLAEGMNREPRRVAGGVTHALEELRHDRPGIPPRTIQQGVGRCGQHLAKMWIGLIPEHAESGSEGQAQVRACVAVRNRENIDAIEILLLPDNAVNSRHQRLRQGVPVDVPQSDIVQKVKPPLFTRQQEILPLMAQHHAIRGDFRDDGTFREL